MGTDRAGFFPQLAHGIRYNEDGTGGLHMYMPWTDDNRKLDFPRGYHIEIWGGRGMPGFGYGGGIHDWNGGGYGKALKDDYRKIYGATVGFSGRGEMIPNEDSYCEIDPDKVDKWGIPVLRFHWKWSDHEIKQTKHMHETFRPDHRADGRQALGPMPRQGRTTASPRAAQIIHEVGTTRMGRARDLGARTRCCQAHEVKNLFVADGGPFTTNADKNVTWTILALAMRTSEHIADERRKGNL